MSKFHDAALGVDHLERLSRGDSPVHRLNTGIKIAVTLFFLMLVVSFPSKNMSGLVPFLIYPMFMMALSDTPYRPMLSRLKFALPFALAGGLSNLFLMRDAAFTVMGFEVTRGLVSFTSIMLKTVLSVFAVLILIATTPFNDICGALTRVKGIGILGLQLLLTYRYIYILLGEAESIRMAYILRAPLKRDVMMRDMGSLLGRLLLRSFSRAERVYLAMKCRGFSGRFHSGGKRAISRRDVIFTAAAVFTLIFLRFFNLSLLIGGVAAALRR
ncbi:MAG: energy-coupling factor transporter transmembrane protein EcfT [Spirochaetaceae bacterium]|nr:energy-coupling factor transporter transmembrane protein EcfT [Spirochaetaceae bacterium]